MNIHDDPILNGTRRRNRSRLVLSTVVSAALVLGAVGVARASTGGSGGYRTATAAMHSVQQSLHTVATIEPVTQAKVSFPVSGTVATVDVAVGDTVTAGQQLATLDMASLQDTIDQKQAALDQAELTLEKAKKGETVGSGGGGFTGGAATSANTSTNTTAAAASGTGGSSGPTGATDAAAGTGELRAAQQAVLDEQRQVDAAMTQAQTALASATQVCAALGVSSTTPTPPSAPPTSDQPPITPAVSGDAAPTDGAGQPTGDTTTTTTTTQPTPTTTAASSQDGDVAACRNALQAVLDQQTQVSASQSALNAAADRLETLRNQVSVQSTGTAVTVPVNGSASAASSSSSGPSSDDLIAYQAAVDAAEVQLQVAQQALKQATIASPIAGTIVSIGIAPGDAVTAASETATVVVQGDGGYEATATLGVDDLRDVKVGDAATVTPDASGKAINGKIVTIGVAATSASTASYPVVINLDSGDADGLRNGALASVDLVTGEAANTLAVPTSAVSLDNSRHTVTVLGDDGKPTITDVEIGTVGPAWTEITSGLSAGQTVVLANLSEPLPGSATSSTNGSRTGRNGGGRGGFTPPAGFRPPG